MDFDVIVVGAGSAGSVVAAHLSEDPHRRVALIEAGAVVTDPDIARPEMWPFLQGRDFDWAYETVPQPGTAGRRHPWPRGRVVGGSSALHAMAHVRGHPEDFDSWATAVGRPLWSFNGLLPGFKRSETFSEGQSDFRGGEGPLPVFLPPLEMVHPLVRAYMEAGQGIGAPSLPEHNAGPLAGVTHNQLTIRDGRRVTVADAYLTPECLERPNLTLITSHLVEKLELGRSGQVVGLVVTGESGASQTLRAASYVISAGTVASPLLLMRSGIGDPGVLGEAGIACRHELPGVGRNLHDHLLAAGNVYRSRKVIGPTKLQHSESLMYLHSDDPSRADGVPDIVLACVVLPVLTESFKQPEVEDAYTIMCGVTHPTSRGSLRPSGPSVHDSPIIDPAYLTAENDRKVFRQSLRMAREVGHAEPLDQWRAEELLPVDCTSDADFDAFLAQAAMTHHHPVGTCSMGQSPDAVTDGQLRVRGIDNLYVVDASVIPAITSGPINAAVIAIAETWSAECAPA